MSVYSILKSCFRSVAPKSIYPFLFGGQTGFSRLVLALKGRLEQNAPHDEVYDRAYYLNYVDFVARSGVGIAGSLKDRFNPGSVIDVGCGSGEILNAISQTGVETFGYDNSSAALDLCREKGLEVARLDLESDTISARQADIVISTEVAEHIPECFADSYVSFLASTAPLVIMTAAPPGQGGTDHVNEQSNAYWIDKFKASGFRCDPKEIEDLRRDWRDRGVDHDRAGNVLIFHREI